MKLSPNDFKIRKADGGYDPRQLECALNEYLTQNNVTTPTKRKRVLAWIRCASALGFPVTRFDAEHAGDHCLNTTISEIGNIDGFIVSRRDTKRPTRFGKDTDCKEYWLEQSQIEAVDSFLGVAK